MSSFWKNNKFLWYVIVLISFFILLLVTKTQIYLIQENKDLRETYQFELQESQKVVEALNSAQKNLEAQWIDVTKYLSNFSEDEMIDYIYSYVENVSDGEGVIAIQNITFSEWKRNELGFLQSDITLNLKVGNIDKLKSILKFLTGEDSKYKFYIGNISFPYWDNGSFNISIPLKIFYK